MTKTKSIVINNNEYIIDTNDNGETTAKTYNKKYKIQININFSNVLNDKIINNVKQILKKDYIDRITSNL